MAKRLDPCEYCSAKLHGGARLVTVYRHRQGRHFIFERVPARVCGRCGERYFSAEIVRQMDGLMRGRGRRKAVRVPLIALKAAG
jgi:YgiT-type zinc finger domain-containing protein